MRTNRRATETPGRSGFLPLAATALALVSLVGTGAEAQVEIAEEVEEDGAGDVQLDEVGEDEDAPGAMQASQPAPAEIEPGVQPVSPGKGEQPGIDALGAPEGTGGKPGVTVELYGGGGDLASELVHVPVINHLFPGVVPTLPTIKSPVADDPGAAHRGMKYFNQFNCIGCHAPNGAGGMGPSLSNHAFIYGRQPENIYLSILQGRPAGMPAWGGVLPDQIIWDIVAYIKSISKDKTGAWGARISADGWKTEQVPAEYMSTTNPWQYTQPFSYGQPPFKKPKGAPPLETPTETLPPE